MSALAESLKEYYNQQDPARENLAISEVEEITMGWETDLYSFSVGFKESGRLVKEERVIRLYPGDFAAEKATKEFNVMSRLFNAGYPVPEVFYHETNERTLGKPFLIMERIRGHNMTDDLLKGSEEERDSLMSIFTKLLVDLHNLDGTRLFPGDHFAGDTTGYVNKVLKRGKRDIDRHDISWLGPLLDWLDEHKTGVSPERLSIVHGDFHTNNIMLREDGSPVVIDWGAAAAGDCRADLAWTILLMSTYSDPGLRKVILEEYQEISGREVRDFEFFDVMAIFRRLRDVSVSFTGGPEEIGMRPGALEKMKQDSEHLHRVYALLKERTGLGIPEFEELLVAL